VKGLKNPELELENDFKNNQYNREIKIIFLNKDLKIIEICLKNN
jgi:hypothetical protein